MVCIGNAQTTEKKDTLLTAEAGVELVVVSSTRSPKHVDSTNASISVLGKPHFQQAIPRTTPEALLQTAGVWIQKTNHGGGSASIRGQMGNQILTLVDGIRLNNATYRYGPNQYLNTVNPFLIEQLEVLRSDGSVQYGSDALGGVIHILSHSPKLREKKYVSGQVLGQFMSHGMEQTGHARVNAGGTKLALTASGTRRSFGDLLGGDTTGIQKPGGYQEYSYDTKVIWQALSTLQFIGAHQLTRQNDVPVYHKVKLENFAFNQFDPQTRGLSYLRSIYAPKIKRTSGLRLTQLNATLSNSVSLEGRQSQKNNSLQIRDERDSTRSLGINIQANTLLANNLFSNFGVERYDDRVQSMRVDRNESTQAEQVKRGVYPDGSTMKTHALFVIQGWEHQRLNLLWGLRWQTIQLNMYDETLKDVNVNLEGFTWQFNSSYQVLPALQLFAAANSAFRSPNIDDIGTLGIVDFRYEIPNDELKPEKAYTFQAGVRKQGTVFLATLDGFYQSINDLIIRNRVGSDSLDGYPLYTKTNSGQAYIWGSEFSFKWFVFPRFSLQGQGTYTFGEDVSNKQPLRRMPPAFGNLNATYQLPVKNHRLAIGFELMGATAQKRLASGDRDDNRIPVGGTPGWLIANGYLQWKIKYIELNTSIQNIGNADYRYHGSGVNGYGRSVKLAVSIHFP